jgi:hypothetical protein
MTPKELLRQLKKQWTEARNNPKEERLLELAIADIHEELGQTNLAWIWRQESPPRKTYVKE